MRRSRWSRTLVVLLLVASMVTLVGAGPSPDRPAPAEAAFAPGRILVKFQPRVSAAQKAATHRARGAGVLEVIPGIDVVVVSVPKGAERAKVAAYARSPLVDYAEPDYVAHALEDPSDEHFAKQWGLDNDGQVYKDGQSGTADADIDAPEAWGITTGDSNVLIAILDTGIDQDHEDLATKIVANVTFARGRGWDDKYGHGTHVAGIAAAITNNDTGVAGLGYNSSLVNVKVLSDQGSGYYSWIVNGIRWAADNGAKVINMSLGGYSYSNALKDAVDYAWNKGVVLAAAAGNDGISDKLYPAAYTNCIAVAATDDDDQRVDEPGWWASNYGDWVDVAAPGLEILSTYPNDGYAWGSGTSMSTPFVSGLAALLWAQGYTSNVDVRDQIQNTADPIEGTGTYWEHGRINACNAVGGNCSYGPPLPPTATPTPTDTVTPTATNTPTSTNTPTPTDTATAAPTNTPTNTPTPEEPTTVTVSVDSITYATEGGRYSDKHLNITVALVDDLGNPVAGASVAIQLDNTTTGQSWTSTGTTETDGTVTFKFANAPSGWYTTDVTGVTAAELTWDGLTPGNEFEKK